MKTYDQLLKFKKWQIKAILIEFPFFLLSVLMFLLSMFSAAMFLYESEKAHNAIDDSVIIYSLAALDFLNDAETYAVFCFVFFICGWISTISDYYYNKQFNLTLKRYNINMVK